MAFILSIREQFARFSIVRAFPLLALDRKKKIFESCFAKQWNKLNALMCDPVKKNRKKSVENAILVKLFLVIMHNVSLTVA